MLKQIQYTGFLQLSRLFHEIFVRSSHKAQLRNTKCLPGYTISGTTQ